MSNRRRRSAKDAAATGLTSATSALFDVGPAPPLDLTRHAAHDGRCVDVGLAVDGPAPSSLSQEPPKNSDARHPSTDLRNTPAEQIKILRAAYAKALTSPDLIAEAKKMGLEAELIHGDEMEALAKEVLNQPAEVIAAMKEVMGG